MKRPKIKFRFYRSYGFNFIPRFSKHGLRWKDKFDTPRCESEPSFYFEWFWFGFSGWIGDDQYWEQWLWVNKYCDGDYAKAKQTWPWVCTTTKKSTWVDY